MIRRMMLSFACAALFAVCLQSDEAQGQERAFGRVWGGQYTNRDYERFYHYPYVYYPQNYWGSEYYRSAESLYYRYPAEMRIPVYNRHWQNYYPQGRRYHWGHQFITDIF